MIGAASKFPKISLLATISCLCMISSFAGQIERYSPKEVEKESSYDYSQESCGNESDDDRIIVEEITGVIFVGSPELVKKQPSEDPGISVRGFFPPGSPEEFDHAIAPYIIGQPLTKNVIANLKRQIILYYRAHHHPVVMVLIPEQDVTNGVLQILVREATIGNVVAKGQKYFSEDYILNNVSLQSGDLIDTDRLLTDVAWLNQNPFHQTNVAFTPGEKNGTTDVELITRDRFPLRVYTGADNTGNPLTGRTRWFAGGNWGNVFNLNHTASFQFTTGTDIHQFRAFTGSYVAPLPWRHIVTVFGGYSRVHPDIKGFNSNAWSAQASMRYKIFLGQKYGQLLQNLQFGYDFKETNNNLEFADTRKEAIETSVVQLGQFELSYHLDYFARRHTFAFDADFFFSPAEGWFSEQTTSRYHKLQPGASPIYTYLDLTLSDEYVVSRHRWKLFFQARGQIASKILLPSEQFGLGGYSTVRGYIERIVNYDNAACLNLEIKTPDWHPFKLCTKKNINEAFYAILFADYGWGKPHKLEKPTNRHIDSVSKTLVGVGPGLRYKIGSYLNARLDVGFPLTEITGNNDTAVLHFSVLLSY